MGKSHRHGDERSEAMRGQKVTSSCPLHARVWDWERSVRIGHLNNQQPKAARITSLEFLNGHDDALLLVGCDDGSVRVWRDYVPSGRFISSLFFTLSLFGHLCLLFRPSFDYREGEVSHF